jgi:hypothetical protein
MLVSNGPEGPLPLPDKSQVSKIFVNDLAIIVGRSKRHSKFKHERICSAEILV